MDHFKTVQDTNAVFVIIQVLVAKIHDRVFKGLPRMMGQYWVPSSLATLQVGISINMPSSSYRDIIVVIDITRKRCEPSSNPRVVIVFFQQVCLGDEVLYRYRWVWHQQQQHHTGPGAVTSSTLHQYPSFGRVVTSALCECSFTQWR